MKTILSLIGFYFMCTWALGMMGIGHVRYYYGGNSSGCTVMESNLNSTAKEEKP